MNSALARLGGVCAVVWIGAACGCAGRLTVEAGPGGSQESSADPDPPSDTRPDAAVGVDAAPETTDPHAHPQGGGVSADAGVGASGGECADAYGKQEFDLTNQARLGAGLPAYTCEDVLALAARWHAEDMCARDFYSHYAPEPAPHGVLPRDRMRAAGVVFRIEGENIFRGAPISPEFAHTSFMKSPAHSSNLLSATFHRMGVGHVRCGSEDVWVQNFAN